MDLQVLYFMVRREIDCFHRIRIPSLRDNDNALVYILPAQLLCVILGAVYILFEQQPVEYKQVFLF